MDAKIDSFEYHIEFRHLVLQLSAYYVGSPLHRCTISECSLNSKLLLVNLKSELSISDKYICDLVDISCLTVSLKIVEHRVKPPSSLLFHLSEDMSLF